MPPNTEPQVVGMLLLFVPGFVALAVAGYIGWPTTRRGDLKWVVYAVIVSLALEVAVRLTIDRVWASSIDPNAHPARRAAVLLLYGLVFGGAVGWLQRWLDEVRRTVESEDPNPGGGGLWYWPTRLAMWVLGTQTESRVWTAFFRYKGYMRLELLDGRVLVAWVQYFSTDPGDSPRELFLSGLRVVRNESWTKLPGSMYLDSSQLRSAIRVTKVDEMKQVIGGMYEPPKVPNA
jgi:hypothetical protein